MAVKNTVGPLIKEARTKAKLTQEQLASKIDGLTASDVGKAERGEKMLTQDILKQIAKTTGVTQKSLLDAARESGGAAQAAGTSAASSAGKTSGKISSSGKTSQSGKTTTGKTSQAGKTSSTGKTTGKASMELTSTERKLVELYRTADSDKKKVVMSLLKGETQTTNEILTSLLDGSKKPDEIVSSLIGNFVEGFANKK
jgi:DNA-binding XRE family transcriptional regulator